MSASYSVTFTAAYRIKDPLFGPQNQRPYMILSRAASSPRGQALPARHPPCILGGITLLTSLPLCFCAQQLLALEYQPPEVLTQTSKPNSNLISSREAASLPPWLPTSGSHPVTEASALSSAASALRATFPALLRGHSVCACVCVHTCVCVKGGRGHIYVCTRLGLHILAFRAGAALKFFIFAPFSSA